MNCLRLALFVVGFVVLAPVCEASVEISTAATKNMSCSAGVCSPTAKKAVLNVNDLTNMLAVGDVKITTGAGAVTITVMSPFSWTSTSRLTLDANYNVSFRAPVTVGGTGGVTITTNDGGSGGDLLFFPGAKLDFWDVKSDLIINGRNYGLVADVKTLAAKIARHPRGSYALSRDYDASADGTYTDVPVLTPFAGRFEGLGHTITNLTITYSAKTDNTKVGLFAVVNKSAVLRNLVLSNPQLSLNKKNFYGHLGSVAGDSAGRLRNVVVVGGRINGATASTRRSSVCAGGLVSYNTGTIIASHVSETQIYAPAAAGGLTCVNGATITQSYVDTSVGAGYGGTAGGVAAYNGGVISLSNSAGDVAVLADRYGDDGSEFAGGIVAENGGTIDRSYSVASVDAGASAAGEVHESYSFGGGLVAKNYGIIVNTYAQGGIESEDGFGVGAWVGGLVGVSDSGSTVTTSYSIGAIDCYNCGGDSVGGFMGNGLGAASDFWDIDTSGYPIGCGSGSCSGVMGLSDGQLKSGLPAGFDPAIWGQNPSINNGYPYLLANPAPQ